MDISEQCGYTIAQQAELFHSIKPLFSNKPLMVVANKTDAAPLESLSQADTATLKEMVSAAATASNGGTCSVHLPLHLCLPSACMHTMQTLHLRTVGSIGLTKLHVSIAICTLLEFQFMRRRSVSNICGVAQRNDLAARGWYACTACTVSICLQHAEHAWQYWDHLDQQIQ